MNFGRKINVLHVITGLNNGGAEAMLAKLALSPSQRRPELEHSIVSLISLGVVGRQLAAQGIAVHDLGMRQGLPGPRGLLRLLGLVRTLQPDIIQGWMYHGNLAACAARQLACRKALLGWNIRHSLHDLAKEKRTSALAIRLGARLSRSPDFTVYNASVAVAEHGAIGFDGRAAVVVPNGFDTELFRPDGPGRPIRARLAAELGPHDERGLGDAGKQTVIVGMIARVHPMKDHANLFAALRAVREAGHDVHLVLAGAGTDRLPANLAAELAAALPAARFTCLGDRRDLAEWLPGLDIAVLSSSWGEGFPNVIGEALACGVPCIATDVGDSREIIGPGGTCVPPDDPAALAAAIIAMVKAGPDARIAMGARGRERVLERYTLERIVRQYEDLYQASLEARRPPGLTLGARKEPSCAG